jgi:hypothetical protein
MSLLPERPADFNAASRAPDLAAELERFQVEAAGLADVRIARICDFPIIEASAVLGARVPLAFITGMASLRRKIKLLERPLCASCDFEFFPKRPPGGLLLLLPAIDEPSHIIASGLCPGCARLSDAQIVDRFAARALVKLWPDHRVIDLANLSRERGRA